MNDTPRRLSPICGITDDELRVMFDALQAQISHCKPGNDRKRLAGGMDKIDQEMKYRRRVKIQEKGFRDGKNGRTFAPTFEEKPLGGIETQAYRTAFDRGRAQRACSPA